jgi:hypothetical protein
MKTIKKIDEFRQQARLFNLTENEIKSDFERQFVKKKRKIGSNNENENITFEQYKNSVSNFLFQNTEEDLLKGFRFLQIRLEYKKIKKKIKSAKIKKDFNLIAKYQMDLDNLVNMKVNN